MGTALSPDGKQLYVTMQSRWVSPQSSTSPPRKQVRSIDGVGDRPWGITTSADGRGSTRRTGRPHDVSIVNLATGNVRRRVTTGGLPWGVAISP